MGEARPMKCPGVNVARGGFHRRCCQDANGTPRHPAPILYYRSEHDGIGGVVLGMVEGPAYPRIHGIQANSYCYLYLSLCPPSYLIFSI